MAKETGVSREKILVDGQVWDEFLFHKIKDFDIDGFNIGREELADVKNWKKNKDDRDLFYAIAAIKLALDDSGLAYDKENNDIGLFLTIEHPGFEPFCEGLLQEAYSCLEKKMTRKESYRRLYETFVQNGYDLQTFMYLFLAAKVFGLHGYSLYTSNACASGLFALESAARQIKNGGSDIAVVCGGDYPGTMFKHTWFKERGIYAEDGKVRPFSADAGGIVFGDGASAVVVEELGHALKRGAEIYAEYLGGGFSLEGWKVTLPQLNGTSYQDAIRAALARSGLNPGDIGLINPHGVGIKITDRYEAKAITDIFSKPPKAPKICALKPYVGHNLGGSAIIETIILLLAMREQVIPATLNYGRPELKYGLDIVTEHSRSSFDCAMKLSCGFAGYNGAAVFRKAVD